MLLGGVPFFWQWGKKCVNSPHAGVEAGRFYGGGGCEIAARRMQKLLPGGCSDSEKQEALSFLCHVCWLRPERRLIRHPWLAGAFWGHPCPQILFLISKDKNFRLFSIVTSAEKELLSPAVCGSFYVFWILAGN